MGLNQVSDWERIPKGLFTLFQSRQMSEIFFGKQPHRWWHKDEEEQWSSIAKLIPHLYQSFLVREYTDRDDLGEGICDPFEVIDVVIKEEIELASILDAEIGE